MNFEYWNDELTIMEDDSYMTIRAKLMKNL